MSQNPFTYGRPISKSERFIGRSAELHRILSRLRNQAFESSSIIGDRRIGKTSLLKILGQKVQGDGMIPVYLDLQMIQAKHTPRDFWEQVLRRLARRVRDDEIKGFIQALRKEESIESFDLDDLFRDLEEAGLSIVLLLDEFEHVAGNTNFEPDFFSALRALAIHHRLALVTTSYTDLSTLSHSDEVRASPFFNIFGSIYQSSFTLEEAEQLIDHYVEGTGIYFTKKDRQFLASIAGTHPYYLQIGGNLLFDAYRYFLPDKPYAEVRRRFADEAEDTLQYSWRHTTDAEKISLTVLALLGLAENDDVPAGFSKERLSDYYQKAAYILNHLVRRGLVLEQDGKYALFSTVFAEWIRNELCNRQTTSQTYEEWLNQPPTQTRLKRLQSRVVGEVTERLLPAINSRYRELIMGWLISDPTAEKVIELFGL